jgi:oligoribonuclease NrnB/cAMP/cGMP phosphodiesterase (DHH superfamily)
LSDIRPLYDAGVMRYERLMISPLQLSRIRTVVTHDDCSDGTASAILLRDALPEAAISFAQYGTAAYRELPAQPGMLFCDLSPPRERVAEFVDAGAVVLDHHRSARDVVEAFGANGVFADQTRDAGVSGAALAFREVWQPLEAGSPLEPFAARFAQLAGIRDTWQTASPLWREACEQHLALRAIANRAWLEMPLEKIALDWNSRFGWLGTILWDRNADAVQQALNDAFEFNTIDGLRVLAFAGLELASDAAEATRDRADVIVAFGFAVDGGVPLMRVSLRSNGDFDASAFAARHGGGGHYHAAGFAISLTPTHPQPFTLIPQLFAAQH